METVNKYMLEDILSPLGGTADTDDVIKYQNIQNNNSDEVKKIISEIIKPYYESRTEPHKASIRRSLSYFLTKDIVNFGKLYDNCLIAFDHPSDPKDFFLWIWDVLFPNQDYHIEGTSNFIELNDPNEANKYYNL